MASIQQSIEVNVPAHVAYEQLKRFEDYPRFMRDVAEVRQLDDTHLHWRTRADSVEMQWDAEITEQVPDHVIAWRKLGEPHYEGRIELNPVAEDKTRIVVSLESDPYNQVLAGHGEARQALTQRCADELQHFKELLERQHPQAQGLVQGQATGAPGSAWLMNPFQLFETSAELMRRMAEQTQPLLERLLPRPFHMMGSRTALPGMGAGAGAWMPPVEIAQQGERLIVHAELPGVRREDVQVAIAANHITIEGDRRPPQDMAQYRRSERAYGRFCRLVMIPAGADADQAAATLHDGVLEITMPLRPVATHGRRVEVHG
jgi:HSP20 family molecular chaperone IbpA